MSATPAAVAIYARISNDPDGTRAGVDRQLQDCRALAESLGWTVAGEYVDNDVSAYSGKKRPEYERMLTDLTDGLVDGVLVYHMDRLTRRPIELEQFLSVVDAAKVSAVRFVSGPADLSTGDGLLVARILAAMAAGESASKSRRVARKHHQNASEGKPHRGSVRPFGYEQDFVTVNPVEAEIYRRLVARFLAGESSRSLALWLTDEQVPTVTGSGWTTSTLKGMLTNARYAGLRVHRGEIVAQGQWEPIITEDDHRRILAKYAEKMRSGRRAPQRYLLSGMLRCGRCGNRMFSAAREDTRRYVCSSGPDHGGCGGTFVTAEPLERVIVDMVLYRLDTPDLADTLAGRSSTDTRTHELSVVVDQANEQLEELSLAFGNREITMAEWKTARAPIQQRLDAAQRQLGQITRTSAITGLVGHGQELATAWSGLNLGRQHAIVAALIEHVTIGPGRPGTHKFDPARVSVQWRH
ncbi:MAG: recombinase family protein [Nocardioidaceae bacterium]|nr:recombinase family protein [Nocardioidaceae bacterium]